MKTKVNARHGNNKWIEDVDGLENKPRLTIIDSGYQLFHLLYFAQIVG